MIELPPGATRCDDLELGPLTSWRVGGRARLAVVATDVACLPAVAEALAEPRWALLGGGTNVLVDDGEIIVPVAVVGRPGRGSLVVTPDGLVVAAAGAPMPSVARFAAQRGLAGLEFLAGIPGSIGGGVRMNAGTGGPGGPCLADVLEHAVVLDRCGREVEVGARELEFAYRSSAIGTALGTVVRCMLRTTPSTPAAVRAAMTEHLRSRRERQPLSARTAGSVFLPAGGRAAGELVEEAGLKAARRGRASVSRKHANWIEAEDGCTAAEVLDLIGLIEATVWERLQVRLEREVQRFPSEATVAEFDTEPCR